MKQGEMRTSGSLKFGTNGTIRGAMKNAPSQEQKKGPYNHWLPSLHWSSIMPQDVNFLLFQARKQEVYSVNFCHRHLCEAYSHGSDWNKIWAREIQGKAQKVSHIKGKSKLTHSRRSKQIKKIYSNFILTFTHSIIKKQTNKKHQTSSPRLQ